MCLDSLAVEVSGTVDSVDDSLLLSSCCVMSFIRSIASRNLAGCP